MKRFFLYISALFMFGGLKAEVSYNADTQTLTIINYTQPSEIREYPNTKTLVIQGEEGLENMAYQYGQYLKNLENLVLPSSITYIPDYVFKNCEHLVNVNWEELTNLKTIGTEAFMNTGLRETLTIPNSVETIKNGAFAMCNNIKTLIFGEESKINIIERNAFKQSESIEGKLSDVYINISPAREIICEHMAFDKFHTSAQTQVGTVTTRLHYPPELFEYYVGVYKSKLYDQNYDVKDENGHWKLDENGNRIHSYGIVTQSIINQSYEQAENGWQEFFSSGIPIGKESLYRTYSDDVAYKVPYTSEFQVYLVVDYDKTKNMATCIQMKYGDIIPPKTGIIVHSNVESTIYMEYVKNPTPSIAYDNELYADNLYHYSETQSYTNYLKPINGTLYIANVEIVDGVKTYRNYFFNKGTTAASRPGPDWDDSYITKGWGFFRAVTNYYRVFNKAYLHLPSTMTTSDSEYIEDSGNLPQNNTQTEANSFEMYILNEEDMTIGCNCTDFLTEIKEKTVEDDKYYTLQGIAINNPIKGIYIKNKRKVIIK